MSRRASEIAHFKMKPDDCVNMRRGICGNEVVQKERSASLCKLLCAANRVLVDLLKEPLLSPHLAAVHAQCALRRRTPLESAMSSWDGSRWRQTRVGWRRPVATAKLPSQDMHRAISTRAPAINDIEALSPTVVAAFASNPIHDAKSCPRMIDLPLIHLRTSRRAR